MGTYKKRVVGIYRSISVLLYHTMSMVYIYLNIYHNNYVPNVGFLPQTLTLIWLPGFVHLETCRSREGISPLVDIDLQGSLDLCDWKHDPHQVDLFGTAVRSVWGRSLEFPVDHGKVTHFRRCRFGLIFIFWWVGFCFFLARGSEMMSVDSWLFIICLLCLLTLSSLFSGNPMQKPKRSTAMNPRRHVCEKKTLDL